MLEQTIEKEIKENDFWYEFVLQEVSKRKAEYVGAVKSNVEFLRGIGCDIRFYYNITTKEYYFRDISREKNG